MQIIMSKSNTELLQDILKSVNTLHKRINNVNINLENLKQDVDIIKKNIIDVNVRLPERKTGFFRDYWENKKE
mgnify:CR=1|tara:strand:+ start:501 stop:719 length:219 start_codon:yes stop_codon:yes gene_type:complete